MRPPALLFLTMRAGPFPSESALPLVRQMAAGLDAAHRAGVVHRDFKPGNVMLEGRDEETRVLITDFGLSREYESDYTLANPGEIWGTIGYIAPELLQGSMATPAAYVYALGVVVHEMLAGRRPIVKPGSSRFLPPSHFVQSLPRFWGPYGSRLH
jgi:serine/threonine-protein kinase